jgi:quinol monooxygenase YgiN
VAYAVIARWTARADEVDEVARCLAALGQASRAEPGNLQYTVHRDPSDPLVFVIYEQYADEAAFEAHVASAHFEELALGDGIPRLSARERQFLVTVGE